MLKEPDFPEPLNEGKSCIFLEGERYIAYLDRDAAWTLLHSLHWFYDQLPGEEFDIPSRPWDELRQRGTRIGYCEFHMGPNHVQKKQGKNILTVAQPTVRHKPHGIYNTKNDRLDFFVSPNEISIAYDALALALENGIHKGAHSEVKLFGTLIIRLVSP